MRRGGQVSIEFLIITGFSLMLLIPLIILFHTQGAAVRGDLTEAQARTAAEALVESAERVYYAGPPSRETVKIYVPDSVEQMRIRNSSVVMRLTTPQMYDMVVPSQVPLIEQSLSSGQGTTSFRVDATSTGVLFTEQ